MPTLAQLRSSIRDQTVGHMPTDDGRMEDGFIDNLIRTKRSLLIRDRARTGLGVDAAFYQDMECFTIERGPLICDGETTRTNEAYIEIPSVEGFRGSIAYLGLVSGTKPFNELSLSSFLRATTDRFCQEKPSYTRIAGKIFLKHVDPDVEKLRMLAVLEDPAQNKCILDFEDTPYPMPNNLFHQVEVLCLKQIMSTLPIVPDVDNDGQDGTGQSRRLNPNALEA